MSLSVGLKKSYYAEAVIQPYSFVKLGTNENQVLPCADGERAVGVMMTEVSLNAGEVGEVYLLGCGAELKISEATTKGKLLSSDLNGYGKLGNAGEWCAAMALKDGAVGDIIPVLLVSTFVSADEV